MGRVLLLWAIHFIATIVAVFITMMLEFKILDLPNPMEPSFLLKAFEWLSFVLSCPLVHWLPKYSSVTTLLSTFVLASINSFLFASAAYWLCRMIPSHIVKRPLKM